MARIVKLGATKAAISAQIDAGEIATGDYVLKLAPPTFSKYEGYVSIGGTLFRCIAQIRQEDRVELEADDQRLRDKATTLRGNADGWEQTADARVGAWDLADGDPPKEIVS